MIGQRSTACARCDVVRFPIDGQVRHALRQVKRFTTQAHSLEDINWRLIKKMDAIEFLGKLPTYCSAGPSLHCQVRIDGAPACYGITAEALEDHFGARSCRPEELLSAYQNHREAIEAMALRLFEITGAHSIVLHSGHFRFGA